MRIKLLTWVTLASGLLLVMASPINGQNSKLTIFGAAKECELVSWSGTKRIQVEIENQFDQPLELFWVNFDGKRRSYGVIEPGQSHQQSTYQDHPWVLTDTDGKGLFCASFGASGKYTLSPGLVKNRKRSQVKLPSRVDNSTRKYFPPVVKQRWNTCSQESAIHYIFSYEMNYQRNADGSREENQYPSTWSWNFVNNGRDQGSEVVEGWHVAQRMGVASVADYGSSGSKGTSGWMTGYDRYYRAMKNRVDSWEFFKITSKDGLDRAREWLFNHGNPELSVGGLLAFDFPPSGHAAARIPAGNYESGKTIIKSWGRGGGHLMTYVGYDDQVGFDFNGDGKITNNQDITGDGKVTIADWERGCFIMVNSWGDRFGERGRAYVPYRSHFVQKDWHRGHWLANITVQPEYQPRMTLRVNMSCPDRSAVRLKVELVEKESGKVLKQVEPLVFSQDPILDRSKIDGPEGYSSFLSAGRAIGRVPFRGSNSHEPIEMGFDLTELFELSEKTKGTELVLKCVLPAAKIEKEAGSVPAAEISEAAIIRYDAKGTVVKTVAFELGDPVVSQPSDAKAKSGSANLTTTARIPQAKLFE